MNRNDVDTFNTLNGQILGTYDEMSLLSKKSPNDAVNKFKLGIINSSLRKANAFLGEKYEPIEGFSEFDVDSIPQNSDVVFVLAQYLQSFEKMRADNVERRRNGMWYWAVQPLKGEKPEEDGFIYIRTVTPKRLSE